MGLSARKTVATKDKYWLDPKLRDTTTPLPGWEGVYNSTPYYMDIALYCMMTISKNVLKRDMKIHDHLSFKDLLKIKKVVTNDLTPCISKNPKRGNKIIFVSSHELGHIIGYAKYDELDTYRPPDGQEKFNAALIEFEKLNWEEISNIIRTKPPQRRILTMFDENFILAKDCEVLSIEELEEYMKNYKVTSERE